MRKSILVWVVLIGAALGAAWAQKPVAPMDFRTATQNIGSVCQRALEDMPLTGKERRALLQSMEVWAAAAKAYEQYATAVHHEGTKGAKDK